MGYAVRSVHSGSEKASLKAKRCERKYNAIIDAAKKVFSKNGFYNTKVSEIAQEAQVASGTIYLYFKNKDDILVRLFDEEFGHIAGELLPALESCSDPRQKLERFCSRYLHIVSADRYLSELVHVEMRPAKKFIKEYQERYFKELLDILGDIIEQGKAQHVFKADIDAALAARMIFGSLDQACMCLLKQGADVESIVEGISSTIIRGMLAEELTYQTAHCA